MHGSLLLLVFLIVTVALAIISKRTGIAYPIVFVVGGAGLAFIPNVEPIVLEPDLILLIVLPPLLFGQAWTTDFREFRANLRPIGLLAIGLVIFTTVIVAAVAHAIIPGLPWAAAFALGAIVSPPDAVAAEAITQQISIPRRILTVLSGESLVNDASALVILRFAIAAVAAGSFSLAAASVSFLGVAVGGVLVGLAVGYIVTGLQKLLARNDLDDEVLTNVVLLFTPFAAYLPAEMFHVSGVLAAVASGMYLSRKSTDLKPDARILGSGVWSMLMYLANAFVFLLLGLQLRTIVGALAHGDPLRLIGIGLTISLCLIVLRFAWVYPSTYVPRILFKGIREREGTPPWTWVFALGYTGMRGIVSLAAALALPFSFPARNEIIFIAFCVIFTTLVGQGLTLPLVIRWLQLSDDGAMDRKEIEVRITALNSGIDLLRSLEPAFATEAEWEVSGRIAAEYRHRIDHLSGHLDGDPDIDATSQSAIDHRFQAQVVHAERVSISDLRNKGEIPDEIYRKIEYDLDLAEARLK